MSDVVSLGKAKKARKRNVSADPLQIRGTGQVQSLTRALRILNTLSESANGLTLSDLAHTVALPTSTVHRLLTTLQNERYVRFDNERSVWLIGVQAFHVGSVYVRSRDLVAIARPYMRRLMEESGETVNLAIVDRNEVIFLAQVECQKMMRAIAGPRRPGAAALFRQRQGDHGVDGRTRSPRFVAGLGHASRDHEDGRQRG